MKLVLKLSMLPFAAFLVYSIPWVLMPWGSEEVVRFQAIIIIVEAAVILAMLVFTHNVLLAEDAPDVEVHITEEKTEKVRKFRRV